MTRKKDDKQWLFWIVEFIADWLLCWVYLFSGWLCILLYSVSSILMLQKVTLLVGYSARSCLQILRYKNSYFPEFWISFENLLPFWCWRIAAFLSFQQAAVPEPGPLFLATLPTWRPVNKCPHWLQRPDDNSIKDKVGPLAGVNWQMGHHQGQTKPFPMSFHARLKEVAFALFNRWEGFT